MSDQGTARGKRRLTRAELKAYEARRAAERQRIANRTEDVEIKMSPEIAANPVDDTSYTMTRNEEFQVIQADLMRLGVIVAILLVMLVAATIVLR
ncbi:MAG: hypothetical protein ACOC9Y_01000 [Chloroflexota bacterium]